MKRLLGATTNCKLLLFVTGNGSCTLIGCVRDGRVHSYCCSDDDDGLCACVTRDASHCLQIPTLGFLYIAGYIGYVGRQYLNLIKADKPTEKEIIIDVPLALQLSGQGWGWPMRVVAVSNTGWFFCSDGCWP